MCRYGFDRSIFSALKMTAKTNTKAYKEAYKLHLLVHRRRIQAIRRRMIDVLTYWWSYVQSDASTYIKIKLRTPIYDRVAGPSPRTLEQIILYHLHLCLYGPVHTQYGPSSATV